MVETSDTDKQQQVETQQMLIISTTPEAGTEQIATTPTSQSVLSTVAMTPEEPAPSKEGETTEATKHPISADYDKSPIEAIDGQTPAEPMLTTDKQKQNWENLFEEEMQNQVEVKRDTIAACITCPLCHKLFRDATTISECLHTFCRKCIYKKLSDEEMECCPICKIDLGCVPLEKLRPDHTLQDIRAKIFPYKRQKVQSPEVVPSVTPPPPIRRKERSISSLVVSTPRVSPQTGTTGRRSKSVARKALRGSTFSVEKPAKKEESSGEDQLDSASSPETLNKFTQNIRQNSLTVELFGEPTPDNETENGTDQWEGKVDLWKPLNCLVEVANRSKSAKFTSQGSTVKSESLHSLDNEAHVRKTKVKRHGLEIKVHDDKNNSGPAHLGSDKPKKMRRNSQKKASEFGGFRISPQTVLDAIASKCERRNNPIWFSLVASEDQEGNAPLPQISASYLRIKDGNIPVSYIQKYLMKKLDLMSGDEVEIRCMGQSIVPTLQVNTLLDMWLETTTSEKVPAITGSSAKDFVMVLVYARKVPVLVPVHPAS